MFHVKRLPMKTLINWKVFWILFVAAILATILLLPYAMEAQSSAIDLTKLPIPLPLLLTLQIAQNAIVFLNGCLIGIQYGFPPRKRANQHQQSRFRQMEVRDHHIDDLKLIARQDKERGRAHERRYPILGSRILAC